jgi:deoxyhypusine synthase
MLQNWETLEGWQQVRGYDFNEPFDFQKFLDAFGTTGIQASNLGKAIEVANQMVEEKAFVFLSCTSNMVSSGNREIIRYLVQHKHVHCLVMSAGAVEEDVIKTLKPFVIGSFDAPGRMLAEKGIGRIGNIFAPYDRYLHFERFMQPVFDKAYALQKERGLPLTPSGFIDLLGSAVDHPDSILHWAAKHEIPVFCPALTDGSLGDLLHFQRQKRQDFCIDVVGDHHRIVKIVLGQEKTGAILLGGSVPKHYVLNANIFKEGLDFAVYLTTATEHDASDSGGSPQEAIAWAKIKTGAEHAKVVADASITFPLLVAGSFARPR